MNERDRLEDDVRTACRGERWDVAATTAIEGYGPEILAYLCALTRDATVADDAFSRFCEGLWRGLPTFRWESSLRTWAYVLAQRAWHRELRSPHRRRGRQVPLSDAPHIALADQIRTRTATFLRSDAKDKLAEVRARLAPDDQTLLILRVDRKLAWRDIARVMSAEGEDDSVKALDRRAAALRKRFERLKDELKAQLARAR